MSTKLTAARSLKHVFSLLATIAAIGACSSSYSHLESASDDSSVYTRFDGRRRLEVGVGWSARFRAVDTGGDARAFDLRSTDESTLVVAPVARDPDDLDTRERAEAGIVFAFLPKRVGDAEVEVIVDGTIAERIDVSVSAQR